MKLTTRTVVPYGWGMMENKNVESLMTEISRNEDSHNASDRAYARGIKETLIYLKRAGVQFDPVLVLPCTICGGWFSHMNERPR